MQPDPATLVEAVARRGGIDREAADRALRATLQALGEALVAMDARALAEELPPPLGEIVLLRPAPGPIGADELFARVGVQAGLPFGFAEEQARLVCGVLAEALPFELHQTLRRRLPAEIAELLEPISEAAPAPPYVRQAREVAPGEGGTLATGRPGSRHALAEAAPSPGMVDSVACAANPHGKDKLASAPGERHPTLATGRPGSTRPLSEGEG